MLNRKIMVILKMFSAQAMQILPININMVFETIEAVVALALVKRQLELLQAL